MTKLIDKQIEEYINKHNPDDPYLDEKIDWLKQSLNKVREQTLEEVWGELGLWAREADENEARGKMANREPVDPKMFQTLTLLKEHILQSLKDK